MPVNLIPINGRSALIDYEEFETELKLFLGPKCLDAQVYVLNNFPAPVSTEANVDLLLLMCVRKETSYSKHVIANENCYFKSAIVPISVSRSYIDATIAINRGLLLTDGVEFDNRELNESLKLGMLKFLSKKCNMPSEKLFVSPVQLLLHPQSVQMQGCTLVNKKLSANQLFTLFKQKHKDYFEGNRAWAEPRIGYARFEMDVQEIVGVAEQFSQYGYITQKKLERIGSLLVKKSDIYDAIGSQPVIIKGKAGTGKTTHLMHMMMRLLSNNCKVTFLTYNHLLTKDITWHVKLHLKVLHERAAREGQDPDMVASAQVQTLMSFIYRLSKALGVLHIMTEARVKELTDILKTSMRQLVNELPALVNANSNRILGHSGVINWDRAIEAVQNSNWSKTVKEYGILFVKFLRKNSRSLTNDLKLGAVEFFKIKLEQLQEVTFKKVFLADYTGCLKNTLDAIRDTGDFYQRFNVRDKFELLDILMSLSTREPDIDLLDKKISEDMFKKRVRNVVKGRIGKKRILMIDEAQDCFHLEREIFYEMFQPENVVATYGGKEQLIRFSEVCNWNFFKSRKIPIKEVNAGRKSYRVKKHILDFCNFIAGKHDIILDLGADHIEDKGELIFDFRKIAAVPRTALFEKMLSKGNAYGCYPVESLLVLDVNSGVPGAGPVAEAEQQIFVNEAGVIYDTIPSRDAEFAYVQENGTDIQFWVGAVADKSRLPFPSPYEVRVINYESCRGLEAWGVICFNADRFYQSEYASEEAETYQLQEDMFLTKEQRAAKYAITWVLMAATRAIDTLCMQMSDKENALTKLCLEFAIANPEKCSIVDNRYNTPI